MKIILCIYILYLYSLALLARAAYYITFYIYNIYMKLPLPFCSTTRLFGLMLTQTCLCLFHIWRLSILYRFLFENFYMEGIWKDFYMKNFQLNIFGAKLIYLINFIKYPMEQIYQNINDNFLKKLQKKFFNYSHFDHIKYFF